MPPLPVPVGRVGAWAGHWPGCPLELRRRASRRVARGPWVDLGVRRAQRQARRTSPTRFGDSFMSMNLVTLLYLVASVCFIQALKGLSHPTTSIRGNVFGMVGMLIAVLTTAALIWKMAGTPAGLGWVLLGLVAGGSYGAWRAKTVEMTKIPELVAFFHSMIGLAAVFIAIAAVAEPIAF